MCGMTVERAARFSGEAHREAACMFDREIHLSPLTEDDLGPLLDAALTADPTDVMPPVSDPIDGWTEGRRQAFRRFHRQRLLGPEPVEKAYVVRVDGHVVGAGRVRPIGTEADIGLWLAPRWRRLGIGSVVAAQLVQLARQEGIREVTARSAWF